MLRNLHIKNLALIHEVDVDFADGLNILTGETGAGKSIIVDSVGLALGGRIQREMARPGGAPALVELVFEVADEGTISGLRSLGIEPEDGVVVISRKIQEGRSTCRVNGETMTTAEVRECASYLLDIHGQSEHQKLLRADRQLELLDAYGHEDIGTAKERVAADFRVYSGIRRALSGEELSEEERARRTSFLEYEIREIQEAELAEDEDEELEKRYRRLANSKKIVEAVSEVHEAVGYDEADSAGEVIGRALKRLENVSEYDERLASFCGQLGEIDALLGDFNREVAEYAGDLSFESDSFEETAERLNLINRLKAKYGRTVGDILAALKEKQLELDELTDYEASRAKLKKELAAAEAKLSESSGALTELRKACAEAFAREASKEFADLNFARADFAIEFRELADYTANGRDAVDFCIATNPGEPRKPLKSVVSGGELSRLMLGIRTMFADTDATDTIIFDEVDTGISGRTAQKAAEKMAQVARRHQVLCITHLPQIAAMADTHYGITKELLRDEAVTNIEALSESESVAELARLIGGAEITDNTLNSAREMKEMCRQFKAGVL